MLIIRGVNVFPTQIEEQILRDQRLSGNYQVVAHPRRPPRQPGSALRSPARTVRQIVGHRHPGHQQGTAAPHQDHHRRIDQDHRDGAFDAIPRTQVGKAKRVLDERPKQN
jgi:phenylacetate-CoA ligase